MMFIHPTHTCFDDAMELLADLLSEIYKPYDRDRLRIVHGVCILPNGEEYAHAWVEYDNECYFYGIIEGRRVTIVAPKDAYYQEIGMKSCTRYSPLIALRESERMNSSGPWIPKYKNLCSKS